MRLKRTGTYRSEMKMRINAPRGQKIVYVTPRPGSPVSDHEKRLLQSETVYTVNGTKVYRSHSTVQLEEIPDQDFNTTLFKEVGELLPEVDTIEEIYLRNLLSRPDSHYRPYDDIEE